MVLKILLRLFFIIAIVSKIIGTMFDLFNFQGLFTSFWNLGTVMAKNIGTLALFTNNSQFSPKIS